MHHCLQTLARLGLSLLLVAGALLSYTAAQEQGDPLAAGFAAPQSARPFIFWDWLNGYITREQITRDLEAMQSQGIGGAMIFQTAVESPPGAIAVPDGVPFMSEAWRALFQHAVGEAARLGLEIGLMDSNGWNCGGPWIPLSQCGRRLVWSETKARGPLKYSENLPPPVPQVEGGRHITFQPETVEDIAVLAIPAKPTGAPVKDWELKAGYREIERTTPDLLHWAEDVKDDAPGIALDSVIDLTQKIGSDGKLTWDVPEGEWILLRLGHALGGRERLLPGPGPGGPMLDHLSAEAMDLHFQATVEKLAADVGEHVGKTFTFVECDSCDLGTVNWTPRMLDEFRRRRGYDMTPYLPALTGRVVGSTIATERFLHDFRRTIGDCIADNHYGRFRELCGKHGLKFIAEAGGPPPGPVDALQCFARTTIPMGEFWTEEHTLNVRGAASAAHLNGSRLVAAEAFTSWQHWSQSPFDLKPFGDRAFCEGMNFCIIHGFDSSPPEAGRPGYAYYAGTHFDPNVTWWERSRGFVDYLARCQYMLRQGLPAADVCCYYGPQVPNFIPPNRDYWYELCPSLGEDYACDFADTETLLSRVSVRDGNIVLPDGMSYRILAFPESIAKGHPCHGRLIQPELLEKLRALATAGATIIWPRPSLSPSLHGAPQSDAKIARIARELWGEQATAAGERRVGAGRIIWGKTPRQALLDDGVLPDFEHTPMAKSQSQRLAYCRRRVGDADIYFVANRDARRWAEASCRFRVSGKTPELWHPDTGAIERQAIFEDRDGRTWLPLRLPPGGSVFVVFRAKIDAAPVTAAQWNHRTLFSSESNVARELSLLSIDAEENGQKTVVVSKPGDYTLQTADGKVLAARVERLPAPIEIQGAWTLQFPIKQDAPKEIVIHRLESWTKHDEPEVRFFSGTATYHKEFTLPDEFFRENYRIRLDLGDVKNLAEVRLNGRECGLLWKTPFQLDATKYLKPGDNRLEVRVTNLWPNRLIGDAALPEAERTTRTNMTVYTRHSTLLESGLLGPVRLHVEKRIPLDRFEEKADR